MALMFPFLLLLLAGLVEAGYYINTYLTLLDSTREAARHAADLDPRNPWGDNFDQNDPAHAAVCGGVPGSDTGPDSDGCIKLGCDLTGFFYHQTACLVDLNMQDLDLELIDPAFDVVISVFGVISSTGNISITERLPPVSSICTPDRVTYGYDGTCTSGTECCRDECAWSWSDTIFEGTALESTGKETDFSCHEVSAMLNDGPNRTSRQNGFVIVEVFYEHEMLLNLPVLSNIFREPFQMHVYSMMPVSAAEPTPTPIPSPTP